MTLIAEPKVTAALMGTMIKKMGVDRVCWGTDAVWTGSPQWQIEGLRRFEIPEDMQKQYGFAPLGPATGPVKSAIFGGNNAKLYGIEPKKAELELKNDKLTALKAKYEKCRPRAEQSALRLCRRAGRGFLGVRLKLIFHFQKRPGRSARAYFVYGMNCRHLGESRDSEE